MLGCMYEVIADNNIMFCYFSKERNDNFNSPLPQARQEFQSALLFVQSYEGNRQFERLLRSVVDHIFCART